MAKINWDDSELHKGLDEFQRRVERQQIKAIGEIADELLRLSQLEVPLDISYLMQSGDSERDGEEYVVSYNTPYAARLHENPQFKFQNKRKGKYLEEPLKKNLKIFIRFFNESMGEVYAR